MAASSAAWQVEIGGIWKSYFGKANGMLDEAFPLFLQRRRLTTHATELDDLPDCDRFVTFGVNGRKMQVDLLTMQQLRVDNKKLYKVCPPQHQAYKVRCFDCGKFYIPGQSSDCRWCQQCWPINTQRADPKAVEAGSKASRDVVRSGPSGEPLLVPLSLQKALFDIDPLKPMKVRLGTDGVRDDEGFVYADPCRADHRPHFQRGV
jgi:hypothetical protein